MIRYRITQFACIAVLTLLTGIIFSSPSLAQDSAEPAYRPVRPMIHPTRFDLPIAQNYLHPIVMKQRLPNEVETTAGVLPVDGDLQVYAVALEWALNDKWSIVAAKDGIIIFDPDQTFTETTGRADVDGGVKYVIAKSEKKQYAIAAKLLAELPLGSDETFQGNGNIGINPSITAAKWINKFQFVGTAGLTLPFDGDEESTMFYDTWHVSLQATKRFFPLVELNHMRVLNEGEGQTQFNKQAGGGTPAIATFEGGDLINLGASNAKDNANLVTMGVGFRFEARKNIDLGVAYEFPLTDKETNLMKSRLTIDAIFRF